MPYFALDRVFMGGAGGPGWVSTNNPSQASNGGGIVILFADTLEGNGFEIEASGTDPQAVNPVGPPDGGGGGGVLLYSLPALPPTVNVNAAGGRAGRHMDLTTNGALDGDPGNSISLYIPVQNASYSISQSVTIPIACDKDDDNDGISDIFEIYNGDHDNDGVPDHSNAQFCAATYAGVSGYNCSNGLPDPSSDIDNDGRLNFEDPDFPLYGGLNPLGVCRNFDKDGDGRPDQLDLDSDNDRVPDIFENGSIDSNGDGAADSDADQDRDGIPDVLMQIAPVL